MTRYRISSSQRYALWKAYDGRCFYCHEPVDFQDMNIDHIVPEWLTGQPLELRQLRIEYEVDENIPDFQINDFCNWVPVHPKCNTRKGAEVFPKKMTLLLLREAQRRIPRVRQELQALTGQHSRARLFGSLSSAIENRHLTVQEVRDFLGQVEDAQHAHEPPVLTFSLQIEDLFGSGALPSQAPRDYPYLCDWLELDLVKHLRCILSTSFHYTQPSERWGDGLSVRIVFPELDLAELDGFNRPWWDILEAASFWEIFGERYSDAFPDPPQQEYFGQLEAP